MKNCSGKRSCFSISFRQLLVVMCLILLAVSIGSISYLYRRRSEEYLDRSVESSREALQAFVTSTDSSLQELESYLFNTFQDNADLNVLVYETGEARRYQAKTAILNMLGQTLRLNGSAQGSFLILPDSSGPSPEEPVYLARYLSSSLSVGEAENIRADILSLNTGSMSSDSKGMWNGCVINGKPCMIRIARAGNAICGAWVSCDSYLESCSRFLAPASVVSLGFMNREGDVVSYGAASKSRSPENEQDMIHIDIPSQVLPGSVRLSLSGRELLNQAEIRFDYVWYVTTILLIMIIIVLVFQFFMYHPIRRLSGEVHALTGKEEPDPIREDYSLKEIAVLSRYINQSIHETRMMKIRNYEARLSEQQTAQEFLLMRHKTHFFINCVSVIHALANEGNDALISEMAVSLTDYLRKIDYENRKFVRLDDELELIHSYIHIQEIRFGDSFRFIEEVPIDLFEAQIPPLILQTFVENAVEHARIHEKNNLICLRAAFVPGPDTDQPVISDSPNKDMLVIDITDNGSGFPEEFRQELGEAAKVRRLSQGHGVGISNAIARLNHIYHGLAEITITNEPGGGAHIHMCLPVLDQEEQGEM